MTEHPAIKAAFTFPTEERDGSLPAFAAGSRLSAVLQLEVRVDTGLAIRDIWVEFNGQQEFRTKTQVARTSLVQIAIPYQGPSLPPSNACTSDRSIGDARGHALRPQYWRAKAGLTTFPVEISLPVNLPTHFVDKVLGHITYTLTAVISITYLDKPSIVHHSEQVAVFEQVGSSLRSAKGLGYAEECASGGRLDIDDSRLSVELRNAQRETSWGLEGSQACVALSIVNNTRFVTTRPILRIHQIVEVSFPNSDSSSTQIRDQVIHQAAYAGSRFLAQPGSHTHLQLALRTPRGLRSIYTEAASVSASTDSAHLRSSFMIEIELGLSSVIEPVLCHVRVPFFVFHELSLSPEMWLQAQVQAQEGRAVEASFALPPTTFNLPRSISLPSLPLLGNALDQTTPVVPRYRPLPVPTPPALRPTSRSVSSGLVSAAHATTRAAGPQRYAVPTRLSLRSRVFEVEMPPIREEAATSAERTSRHLRESSRGRGQSVSPDRNVPATRVPRPARRVSTPAGPRAQPNRPAPSPPVELLSPRPRSYHEVASYFERQVEYEDDIVADLETVALRSSPEKGRVDLGPIKLIHESDSAQHDLPAMPLDTKAAMAAPRKSNSTLMLESNITSSPLREPTGGSARGGRGGKVTSVKALFDSVPPKEAFVRRLPVTKPTRHQSAPPGSVGLIHSQAGGGTSRPVILQLSEFASPPSSQLQAQDVSGLMRRGSQLRSGELVRQRLRQLVGNP